MLHINSRQTVRPHAIVLDAQMKPVPAGKMARQFVAPGEALGETQMASRLYRVLDGGLAVYRQLADGRRQVIDIAGPGRVVAHQPERGRDLAIKALTYTEVEVLDPLAHPDMAGEAAHHALDRLARHATLLGRMNAMEKVANGLLDLAGQFPRKLASGRPTLTLYLTRADLADWLGLTIETVSRTLNQFKRAGVIDFTHAEIVTLTRPERLKEIAAGGTSELATPKKIRGLSE
jgi:CRP/FNR family transcriptional regulator